MATCKQIVINALKLFWTNLKGNVVNNLSSTSTNLPLSANQGRILNSNITNILAFDEKTGSVSDISVTSDIGTFVNGASVTLGKTGLYLIIASAEFPSHSTEVSKRLQIYNASNGTSEGTMSTYGKNYTRFQNIAVVKGTKGQKYTARLSAGAAISKCSSEIYAVCILPMASVSV